MTSAEFNNITEWLQQQTESVPYGEIIVKITLHDGVRYIERIISEKIKVEKI